VTLYATLAALNLLLKIGWRAYNGGL